MSPFERIAELERTRVRYAIATVVARRSPVSSHLGDRALIFADGGMEGFVGGSCSRDIVRRHAVAAIANRRPLLLQIRPDASTAGDASAEAGAAVDTERVVIPMSCSSEGAVDVYIEPRVPLRRLVIVGFTPVAQTLARVAAALDYDVVRVVVAAELRDMQPQMSAQRGATKPVLGDTRGGERAEDSDACAPLMGDGRTIELQALSGYLHALDEPARRDIVAVVASQGHYDELALEILLEFDLAFVGLLASRRRAATVTGVLAQQGVTSDRLATIRTPVGLDIGARSPGDVAVSIFAQIIAHQLDRSVEFASARELTGSTSADPEPSVSAATAVDPICGMDVVTADALYRFDYAGTTYVFCCAHCRTTFAADPEHRILEIGMT